MMRQLQRVRRTTRLLPRQSARAFSTRPPRDDEEDADATHFGYRDVPADAKAGMVGAVFSRVANSYDLMNDVMSAGVHRLWKDHLVHSLGLAAMDHACAVRQDGALRVLDVAGGTGDIAFRMARELGAGRKACAGAGAGTGEPARITVCDINGDMLSVGEKRAASLAFLKEPSAPELDWVRGDAEEVSRIFGQSQFDLYTIAFGIRNVTRVPRALAEAHRVLRKGGRFVCLEFSRVENPLLRSIYDQYSFNVIPKMGQAVANDADSYHYLVESIRKFPPQEEFAAMIREAGFEHVAYENLTNGVVAIHTGFKL